MNFMRNIGLIILLFSSSLFFQLKAMEDLGRKLQDISLSECQGQVVDFGRLPNNIIYDIRSLFYKGSYSAYIDLRNLIIKINKIENGGPELALLNDILCFYNKSFCVEQVGYDINLLCPLYYIAMFHFNLFEFLYNLNDSKILESKLNIFHSAAANNKKDVFLEYGDVFEKYKNDADINGMTPMHFAVQKGNLEIVKILLKFGVNVNILDDFGKTPLRIAIQKGYLEIIKILLDAKASLDNLPNLFVFTDLDVIKFILRTKKIDVNFKYPVGETLLHCAAKEGYLEMMDILLVELGADINAKSIWGDTPLDWAFMNNKIDAIKFLLSKGAVLSNRILKEMVSFGCIEKIKIILDTIKLGGSHLKQLNKRALESLLFYVVNNAEIVGMVLSLGVNVNCKNFFGQTPLHVAAYNNYLDVVRILLDFGANPMVINKYGKNVLDCAAKESRNIIQGVCFNGKISSGAISNISSGL